MIREGAHGRRDWWKDAIVYQIYPRSFLDTNGDGVGDLDGVTAKLDYLKALGVDVLWLSPHFDSPNADNGYDIRDYRKVMREFGDMAAFDRMLAGILARGMRLIVDLVVNHTSDEHEWFLASRRSLDDPHRDFYIWRDGKDGGPPNNYPSFFGGSAWEKDEATGQYYLHYFAKKQPDLNWENPKVRDAVTDIMRFWLDKGVSGFRMDVIPFVSKRDGLPDLTDGQLAAPEFVYADGPRIHRYLHDMNRTALAPYGAMSVGEAFGVDFARAPLFTDARRGELSMIFQFDAVRIDRDGWRKKEWTLPALKAVYAAIDRAAGEHGWATSFLGNHDNPRLVSHFGDDSPEGREPSAKALAALILTQRATPFLYQGDELGMTNYPFGAIEEYDDVEVKGQWRELVETGRVPADEYLSHLAHTSRDHSRTPMQWSAEPHGGFTSVAPWLAVNPNAAKINAESQIGDPRSIFAFYQRLIALRKGEPALVHGAFHDLDPAHPQVFAYTRALGAERFVVVLNLSRKRVDYRLPGGLAIGDILLDSAASAHGGEAIALSPWRALIARLRS